ncbi:hypothetical protein [Ammoniphilus resinae]|nr:hypothetical protein [Ammoniphilus resinae]
MMTKLTLRIRENGLHRAYDDQLTLGLRENGLHRAYDDQTDPWIP